MARKSFAMDTQPHVAEISGVEFFFAAEIVAEEMLTEYSALYDAQAAVIASGDTPTGQEAGAQLTAARELVEAMMTDESRATFKAGRYPDRIVGELLQWITEVHGGLRPTGPSTDSSPSASTNGNGSMDGSQPLELATLDAGLLTDSSTA